MGGRQVRSGPLRELYPFSLRRGLSLRLPAPAVKSIRYVSGSANIEKNNLHREENNLHRVLYLNQ
jgi:hypothetical protein